VLRRIARSDPALGKHLAETEAGLAWLDAGDLRQALSHLVESFNVEDHPSLVTAYSRDLIDALERRGVVAPELVAARGKLARRRFGSRGS
jgi:hypothetical protein